MNFFYGSFSNFIPAIWLMSRWLEGYKERARKQKYEKSWKFRKQLCRTQQTKDILEVKKGCELHQVHEFTHFLCRWTLNLSDLYAYLTGLTPIHVCCTYNPGLKVVNTLHKIAGKVSSSCYSHLSHPWVVRAIIECSKTYIKWVVKVQKRD